MSNVFRYQYGETNPIIMAVESASVIEIGDLCYLNTDDVLPASSQADQTSEAANQRLFAAKFLGVSAQQSRDGDVTPLRINTTGVFEFACASGSFEVGDLVGVDEHSGGTALLDQTVVAVANEDLAIGRVVKTAASVTSVLVAIQSRVVALANIGGSSLYIPTAAQQALSGAGAASLTAYYTAWTTTGSNALTLADGVRVGQLKKIKQIVDGGVGTLTPTSFGASTSVAFEDAGDFWIGIWNGAEWVTIEVGNDADGATAPAIT